MIILPTFSCSLWDAESLELKDTDVKSGNAVPCVKSSLRLPD